MLRWSELSMKPPETVFSWQNPDTKQIRVWAIDRLNKWLAEGHVEVSRAPVDESLAKWFFKNRGIEPHRVTRLTESLDHLTTPIVVMLDRSGPKPYDVTLDGHHRYVAFAMLNMAYIPVYALTSKQASAFEIIDPPVGPGYILDPSRPSGL